MSKDKGQFFQICKRSWDRMTDKVGVNAAVAYLIMASGSDKTNQHTSWSVAAIDRYTGMGKRRAKLAIEALCGAELIRMTKGEHPQSHPRYDIIIQAKEPDWIWLPSSLVTGVAGETPPIERLRAMQEPWLLQGFIELYGEHALADDGGIPPFQIGRDYNRELITDRGRWKVWGFKEQADISRTKDFPLWRICSSVKTKAEFRKSFWEGWKRLVAAGLFECVPHLFEGHTAEAAMIIPCPTQGQDGTEAEIALGEAISNAAIAMVENAGGYGYAIDYYDFNAVLPDRYANAQLFGVYRLRYRPKTKATAAWIAQSDDLMEKARGYNELAERYQANQPLDVTIFA